MSDFADDGQRPTKRVKLSPPRADHHDKSDKGANQVEDTKEDEVGITEYATADSGASRFEALLKVRYTDFLVNEILPGGKVVHLTDMSVPKKFASSGSNQSRSDRNGKREYNGSGANSEALGTRPTPATPANGDASKTEDGKNTNTAESTPSQPPSSEISEEDKQKLVSCLNETAVSELLDLYKSIIAHPTRKAKDHSIVQTEFTKDRSERAATHQTIREVFSGKIESSTDQEGLLTLSAANPNVNRKANPRNNGDDDGPKRYPGKLGWIERGGEYLHFTLYKENKDTMEAISFLVRQLKMNAKAFQFAGTKDRRAVTVQRVSAHRVDVERLARQNQTLRNAALGDFEYLPSGLELGDLGGNEFVLTLRDCKFPTVSSPPSDEELAGIEANLGSRLRSLHSEGYLNYYGLQRFGTFTTRTDTTGLYILQGNYRGACEAILQYSSESLAAYNDSPDQSSSSAPYQGPGRDETARAKAISLFQTTSSSHKPLEILPKKFSAESQLIRHLSRSPTDYIGALLNIPRNLRLMYVHAYQSLVWNKAATHRWQNGGSAVLEGDLVLVHEHKDKETTPVDEPGDIDADGEIIIAPSVHDRANQKDDIFDRARALSVEEAASGMYNIFDVVLPLPGYDVFYPSHATGEFYKTFMGSEEGGKLDPNDMRRKQRDFSLSGGYRKLLARIGPECSVKMHRYARDEEQFVQTDLERIKSAEGGEMKVDKELGGDEVKDKVAAVLKFQLGASQYATMVLRELSRGGIVGYKADFGGGR